MEMKKKKESLSQEWGVVTDSVVKIENGLKRKNLVSVMSSGELLKDGLGMKRKLKRNGATQQDVSANSEKKSKRKRGDAAAEDNLPVLESELKRKGRGETKRENIVGPNRKMKEKRRNGTLDEDTAEHSSLTTQEEGAEVGNGSTEKPSSIDAVAQKYVPPHLRGVENGSQERIRLERRIRGFLNRLTEGNVESITSDVSTIFQAHGRCVVTEIISVEIVGACQEGPRGNDQYAAMFAAFVAGIAATSGMDFGANFVAALATSFEDMYQQGDSLGLRNLALLFSHLYNFRLLPGEVPYQVLNVLCKRFEELDVATMLTILQSCGMGLRGDDPMAMKAFVLAISQRAAEAKADLTKKEGRTSGDLSKRVQFMLETICDIKNNKRQTKEIPTHTRLKKWLQKLGVEDVQLRAVTWKSLLDPGKKGQWWLPSAFNAKDRTDIKGEVAGAMDAAIREADKMLHLAASQRMNTDSRKSIFCMVMSGEDYVDAFEKIIRMKLPGTQDREVLRVIVECCLQEKLFNKYYALLAAKLCDYDKNHKFTLQYCLWKHFKQLDAMELRRTVNLARFLGHMIGSYSLSLSVLKAVDFTDPHQTTAKVVIYFRIVLDTLLTEYSEEVIWNCFSRVAAPPNLATLRDGLALFLHQQTKHPVGGTNGGKEVKEIVVSRYRVAKKALANVAGLALQ